MKNRTIGKANWIGPAALGVLFVFGPVQSVSAQWLVRNIALEAGWNSVFLDVDPEPATANDLFAGFGIEQVRMRASDPLNPIPDCPNPPGPSPDCEISIDNQWRTWLPPHNPLAVANTLRIIRGGTSYLIKAKSAATIQVTGKPSPSKTVWRAGYNFVGFHVTADATAAPTFDEFLAPSAVHPSSRSFALLGGEWTEVEPASTHIEAATGYWITASQASDYSGPVDIDDSTLRGIDFGRNLSEHPVRLRAHNGEEEVTLQYLPPAAGTPGWAGDVPLVIREYMETEAGSQFVWNPLETYALTLTAAPRTLRLGMDRSNLHEATMTPDGTGAAYQGLLSITDQNGFQRFIPLEGQMPGDAGLWVGTVTVDQVAWVHASIMGETSPTANTDPRPSSSPFTFRVIIHVDDMDNVKLLSEVMLLWDDSLPPSGDYVLVTSNVEPTYLALLKPTGLQDGQSFTRRISTANYVIRGEQAADGDSGAFGAIGGDPLEFTFQLPADDPLNPFKHAFHPDHDCVNNATGATLTNCDEVGESYDITRTMSFTFTEQQQDTWKGDYEETLIGLNKTGVEINVSGTFELARVSMIGALNNGM